MSTVRANSITNSAGSGAPDFPNGLTNNGVALIGLASNVQTFTSSGTWTKPAGVSFVFVECISGGDSGSAQQAATPNTGGGNGGMSVEALFVASAVPSSVSITVGAGGAAVSRSTAGFVFGNAGGSSSFGSLLNSSAVGALGFRYSASGAGNTTYGGGAGGNGINPPPAGYTSILGGNGGNGAYGTTSTTASSGIAPGGGGGGCGVTSGTATSGAGARGEVRIWTW